jgi:tRNA A58 N-methylase Trm61
LSAFTPGEHVLILDPTGRRHLIRLEEQGTLHHHQGAVQHADVIGQPEGSRIRSSQGRLFTTVRPRLLDAILEMPRKSGIVYPKDAAHLLAWADIAPGHRVLESGVGSGALTLALLRTVGERNIYKGIVDADCDRVVLDLAVRAEGRYAQVETNEVLLRGWYVQGAAVRPEHEMVGHTGFVTVARLVAPPA